MEPYSEEAYRDAYRVCWKAEELAGVHRRARRSGVASVPPEWTAWLLMEKAGVPRPLIAAVCSGDRKRLGRHLMVVKALMMFPPYAARIETLMKHMPRYGAAEPPALKSAKEPACAAHLG